MKRLVSILVLAVCLSPMAFAICSGSSTDVDAFYTANNSKAITSLTQGFDWSCETTSAGVLITMTFNDDIAGMAAPNLFLFDNLGVLIGNPIAMTGWDAATRTATHTVTGYATGDQLVFLVQVACSDGVVLFSGRVKYIVGDDCADQQQADPLPTCSDTLDTFDSYYSTNSPAVDASLTLPNGYIYTCSTAANNDVNIAVKFLDYLPGMAAPQLFLFHDVEGNEQLDGNPIPMEWFGTTALYTLSGKAQGEQVRFLVQLAYELHVLFTDRITYTVGQDCSEEEEPEDPEEQGIDDISLPKHADKIIYQGQLYLRHQGQLFDAQGVRVK